MIREFISKHLKKPLASDVTSHLTMILYEE
jgi:hypothetical protein